MLVGCLIVAAAGWYLLKELALLLRPLLMAVLLCYVIFPIHRALGAACRCRPRYSR